MASVQRQTFADFELLVIGDGCTDDSEAVVAAFGDPRFHWENLPQNHGHQSPANNRGLALARGKWIAYLGHDDLWMPNHLELLWRAASVLGPLMATVGATLPGNAPHSEARPARPPAMGARLPRLPREKRMVFSQYPDCARRGKRATASLHSI